MRHLLLAGAALALSSCGPSAAPDDVQADATAPELQAGKQVFAKWCAPCHAANPGLAGTMSLAVKYAETDIPAALEDRTDLAPETIDYFVRTGVAWMPPFRRTEISEEELAQLSAYLTAPLEDRGPHALLLADEMVRLERAE